MNCQRLPATAGTYPQGFLHDDWSGSDHLRSLPSLTSLSLQGVIAEPLEGLFEDAAACSHLTSLSLEPLALVEDPSIGAELLWDSLLSGAAFRRSIRSLKLPQSSEGLLCLTPWMVAELLVKLMPQLEALAVGVMLQQGGRQKSDARRLAKQLRDAGLPVARVHAQQSSGAVHVWEEGRQESRLTCYV